MRKVNLYFRVSVMLLSVTPIFATSDEAERRDITEQLHTHPLPTIIVTTESPAMKSKFFITSPRDRQSNSFGSPNGSKKESHSHLPAMSSHSLQTVLYWTLNNLKYPPRYLNK